MSFFNFKFILDLHKDWGGLTVDPDIHAIRFELK